MFISRAVGSTISARVTELSRGCRLDHLLRHAASRVAWRENQQRLPETENSCALVLRARWTGHGPCVCGSEAAGRKPSRQGARAARVAGPGPGRLGPARCSAASVAAAPAGSGSRDQRRVAAGDADSVSPGSFRRAVQRLASQPRFRYRRERRESIVRLCAGLHDDCVLGVGGERRERPAAVRAAAAFDSRSAQKAPFPSSWPSTRT